jgi:hypothetical protein
VGAIRKLGQQALPDHGRAEHEECVVQDAGSFVAGASAALCRADTRPITQLLRRLLGRPLRARAARELIHIDVMKLGRIKGGPGKRATGGEQATVGTSRPTLPAFGALRPAGTPRTSRSTMPPAWPTPKSSARRKPRPPSPSCPRDRLLRAPQHHRRTCPDDNGSHPAPERVIRTMVAGLGLHRPDRWRRRRTRP